MTYRRETDVLGAIEIDARRLYGANTQRALNVFPVGGGKRLGDYPMLVKALLRVKCACASTNQAIGALSGEIAGAILAAADALIVEFPVEEFPVASLHGGGGTSANMNVNEVLANVAEESLGGCRGQYRIIHPNDHVNLNQSTNDVYPTACRLAVLDSLKQLRAAHQELDQAITTVIENYGTEQRLARTCLQDALPVTFADFFGGYRFGLQRSADRVFECAAGLEEVNLGGTVCGRNIDAPAAYRSAVVISLAKIAGVPRLRPRADLFDAAQNADDLAAVSACLDVLCRQLIKIALDLRLLNSGPIGGIKEIDLPAVVVGSSVMPGKINPVIPEYAIQLSLQAVGRHHASAAALSHAELDLNVWESLMTCNILDMTDMLSVAMQSLAVSAFTGLRVMPSNIQRHLESPTAALTELARSVGYSEASRRARQAAPDRED